MRVNTCSAMRNLLEHFKGKIFKKAMKNHEQKIKWNDMVDRLCIKPFGSLEYKLLINEENTYNSIFLNLTEYFKNRLKCTENAIFIERTKLLVHLHTVINLIKE